MWAGDCSFDHHNEIDSIANDLINAPPIETEIYEPRQKSPQRSYVRIDWSVPGVGDFSIESIPESSHQQMNMNCMKVQCSRTRMN